MASIAQLSATEGLPSSVHTEIAILGAMLLDGLAIRPASSITQSIDRQQRGDVDLITEKAER